MKTSLVLLVLSMLFTSKLLAKPIVAEGFNLSQFANVPNARQMAMGKRGTLFVGSRGEGKVHAVLKNGSVIQIAEGLNMPSGLALDSQGDLYIAAVNQIYRLVKAEQAIEANKMELQLLNDDLPDASHHGWKFIDFDPVSGDLIVPIGAPCNICLVYPESGKEPFGTLLSVNKKALNSGELNYKVIAQGVRNSVGFAWHPDTQELWFTDNGRDWMGDDTPPCEINRLSEIGQHFGYPFRHGDLLETNHNIRHKMPKNFRYTSPVIKLQAHSAPLGMTFYQGSIKALSGALLVAEHGSWNRTVPVGYRLSAYWLKNNQIHKHVVLVNWLVDGEKLGRPVDIETLPTGELLISDDAGGIIWQLGSQDTKSP